MKKPRFFKTDFKTSEGRRFQRRILPLLVMMLLALAGPAGIWLRSTRVSDYKDARQRADTLTVAFQKDSISDVLMHEEMAVTGLIPGTEKQIFWPPQSSSSPTFALISFHGFMATRQELSPVLEDAATQLQVPLYFSRVAHHGIQGDDLSQLSLSNYVESIAEAEVIGARLAPQLVLVGVSTGAPMAMMMAAQSPESTQTPLLSDEGVPISAFPRINSVRSLILIAPNFGLPRWDWRLASGPLGEWITRLAIGPHYRWTPRNEEHRKYWTTEVSSRALRPMVEMVQLGMRAGRDRRDWSDVSVLLVQNPNDHVVDNASARDYLEQFHFKRFEIVEIPADDHVLAGRIVNPEKSQILTQKIVEFLSVP